MDLHHVVTHDATAAEVFAVLAQPAFRERVAAESGAGPATVEVTPLNAEGMTVRVTTPGVVRVERWLDARHAEVTEEHADGPVTLTGTLTLVESAGTTTGTMSAQVTGPGPGAGAELESRVATRATADMDTTQVAGAAWLKGGR